MRYTTLIDISEVPGLYKNKNCRLLYLHMCLRAGYHDNDRDVVELSIRQLAFGCGLTVSATRHALQALEENKLIKREGAVFVVKKWLEAETISTRPKTKKQQQEAIARAQQEQQQATRDRQRELERQRAEQLINQGKTSFMIYYEDNLKRAAEGDVEAKRVVNLERNQRTYEEHKKQMQKEKKQ